MTTANTQARTEPEDAAPLEARYTQRAESAARAADAALRIILPYSGGTELQAARVEAAGRIAAALIRADKQD